MKKIIKTFCSFILLFILLPGNAKAQNEFKEKITPILDSIGSPYKLAGEDIYMVTYCENYECIPVYIKFKKLSDTDHNWWYIRCFTFLYTDNVNPTPSKSVIQKVYDLNSASYFGRFSIDIYEQSYSAYYMNEIWFDNLTVRSLFNNIYLSYIIAQTYKKEFDVFKE
jgi:hypothetical protein